MTAILVLAVVACFMTNPRQPKESTAQGSNYIDLNQPPILDVIQNGQTISDRSSSEDRQREVELESALLGEAIKKQESLTQIQTTDFTDEKSYVIYRIDVNLTVDVVTWKEGKFMKII